MHSCPIHSIYGMDLFSQHAGRFPSWLFTSKILPRSQTAGLENHLQTMLGRDGATKTLCPASRAWWLNANTILRTIHDFAATSCSEAHTCFQKHVSVPPAGVWQFMHALYAPGLDNNTMIMGKSDKIDVSKLCFLPAIFDNVKEIWCPYAISKAFRLPDSPVFGWIL